MKPKEGHDEPTLSMTATAEAAAADGRHEPTVSLRETGPEHGPDTAARTEPAAPALAAEAPPTGRGPGRGRGTLEAFPELRFTQPTSSRGRWAAIVVMVGAMLFFGAGIGTYAMIRLTAPPLPEAGVAGATSAAGSMAVDSADAAIPVATAALPPLPPRVMPVTDTSIVPVPAPAKPNPARTPSVKTAALPVAGTSPAPDDSTTLPSPAATTPRAGRPKPRHEALIRQPLLPSSTDLGPDGTTTRTASAAPTTSDLPPVDAGDLPPQRNDASAATALRGQAQAGHAQAGQTPARQARAWQAPTWQAPGVWERPSPASATRGDGSRGDGSPECRFYSGNATVFGRAQPVQGIACRQPDGSWKLVSGTSYR